MSNSPLAKLSVPAHIGNYTKGRSSKITKITLHHMAGVLSAQRCGELFQAVGRNGSAHYGIGNDGTIAQYVPETDTAWADGNWNSNCTSVSIETSNSATGGDWKVSDAALRSLIKLCADIAKRNGLGKLVAGKNLTWHSMYSATACPGPYLKSKMDYIAMEANKINYPEKEAIEVKINGINTLRLTDYLVIYNIGNYTGTNQWGVEVAFDSNCVAISDPVCWVGNMKIPSGGFVLSGHNKAGNWIAENIKKGTKLNLSATVK
ncbi:MAG: N-acetylmuramoyl-L-alanine amidase [Clostridia bacterium]|nr:N-acetylmuramoyl-L-alanine amidase [Clostridia bacterium]